MSFAQLSAMRAANELAEEILAYHVQRGNFTLADMDASELGGFVHHIYEGMMGAQSFN
jgi:alpha-D-ribose 1-methylphosphonate 5-triphosphate synthase subunit PhnI